MQLNRAVSRWRLVITAPRRDAETREWIKIGHLIIRRAFSPVVPSEGRENGEACCAGGKWQRTFSELGLHVQERVK